ncbi:MAG: ABC transporter permease [Ilumatobacteraceae bacterium]
MSSSESHLTPGQEIIANYKRPSQSERAIKSLRLPIQAGKIMVIALAILIWHFIYKWNVINKAFIASPKQTLDWYGDNWNNGEVWRDMKVTLREALLGWIAGSTLGLLVGLLMARFKTLWDVTSPVFVFLNAAPRTAFAPILILIFGLAETSKVILAASIVFFIVMVPTRAAAGMVDPDLETVMTTMGGRERDRFFKVILPSVLTSVFGAIRLGSVWALLGATFAELFGAKYGLGLRYIAATNILNMPEAFGVIFIIAMLAILINGVIGLLERRLMRWQATSTKGSVMTV